MACIRFDFEPEVSAEEQDEFLANINKSWTAVEKALRLVADSEDADRRRRCYLKLKPGQVDIERIARSLAASLRATSFIQTAFIVDEGWPISE